MIKYLKYIVLIFTTIGVIALSFFLFQNKTDVARAWNYSSRIDYDYLKKNCHLKIKDYLYPCIKKEFSDYVAKTSLTGTSIGMKMVFNVMDEDKEKTQYFQSKSLKDFHYAANYLEINNLALSHTYRNYYGFESLYGGFIASLEKFYSKGYEFSENLILGLEGPEGIETLENKVDRQLIKQRLAAIKEEYYQIKKQVNNFLEAERERLSALLAKDT
ncbi:MAG: hypothetical protein CME66_10890 [Halobacteriovoraceae bacterium]|nr:hypothetical protein [Halobacteriovoraceae bacterium]|tara:strand:- start:64 stop:711 length:648 start_codon:yes stop_codon:yes gene_type:complete